MSPDTDALGERIAEHVAHIDAAMHLLLTDLREFDQAGGWCRQGFQTCAHWLSWRVGWTVGTAREHVRVAGKLAELPLIDDALRRGEISYCKVRAMTRVATKANEYTLLGEAQHTTGEQLERICRKYAMVQRHGKESNEKDDSERRYVQRHDQADGMVRIVAALHPEEAATVWAALERIVKEGYRRRPGASETQEANVASDEDEVSRCAPSDPASDLRCDASGAPTEVPAGTRSNEANVADAFCRNEDASDVHCDVPAGTWSNESRGANGLHRSGDSDLRCDASAETTGRASQPHDEAPAGTPGWRADDRAESHPPCSRDSARAQRFSRADALVVIAEEVIRGSRPNRSPIELVVTVAAADLRAHSTNPTSAANPTSTTGPTNPTNPASAASATSPVLGPSMTSDSAVLTVAASDCCDPMKAACYADGTAVSLAVARRLACDAGIVGLIESDDGQPLSVGRKTRAIPGAMKRALLKRDGGCRFPGCTNRLFVEGHHLRHWADGGETKLDNLVSTCSLHHRFVHEYGYAVELKGTEARFVDPDGNVVRAAPEPARPERLGWETIRARNAELAIDADTPACGWDGGRIDLVACIDELVRADDCGGAVYGANWQPH
jgi:hypothetical protein